MLLLLLLPNLYIYLNNVKVSVCKVKITTQRDGEWKAEGMMCLLTAAVEHLQQDKAWRWVVWHDLKPFKAHPSDIRACLDTAYLVDGVEKNMNVMSTCSADTITTTSCSDCKLELVEKRWTQVLLRWLNKCVYGKETITRLNNRSLVCVINKYKEDICIDDMDRAFLCSDDLEPFVKFKYPILRLHYFCEEKEYYKRLYILTTVLLYHCCVSSIDGQVDSDICAHLEKWEQELILKFCERLTDMEVTCNNVECAIKDACEAINVHKYKRKPPMKMLLEKPVIDLSGESCFGSDSTLKAPSKLSIASDTSHKKNIQFKSSITVLPSAVTETSSCSDIDYEMNYSTSSKADSEMIPQTMSVPGKTSMNLEGATQNFIMESRSSDHPSCLASCSCSQCGPLGVACGDSDKITKKCLVGKGKEKVKKILSNKKQFLYGKEIIYILIIVILISVFVAVILALVTMQKAAPPPPVTKAINIRKLRDESRIYRPNSFICKNNLCKKVYVPTYEDIYLSLSRCILQCMGPQLWPYPIGLTSYSKNITALATSKLEYKFQSVPSVAVHQYIAEAFKLFIGDLVNLEKYNTKPKNENSTQDLIVRKMNIQLDVESDPDPRVKVDTDESYSLKLDIVDNVAKIRIVSPSFCGVRHGLETLSQLILFDEASGYLITANNIVIKDAPSFRYRGLMIDTGRNFIPVPDLMRTIDAMSTCKLNTFHWRISDATSFPLQIPSIPQLSQYGAFGKKMIYTKENVQAIVKRAGIRGIRVLIEVAAPGPVGRAWSWSPDASCPAKTSNYSCNNVLCLRLSMRESVMDVLQAIYSEILEMTKVDDIFHLSDSLASMVNCFFLVEERQGFLVKALERLRIANKGFLPTLPIIWYSAHLAKDMEAKYWDRYGVQLAEWQPNPSDQFLSKFKVIHSSKWDLSCEVKKLRCKRYRSDSEFETSSVVESECVAPKKRKQAVEKKQKQPKPSCTKSVQRKNTSPEFNTTKRTWQEMYAWKMWRNLDVFTIEGGEALLWTDMVDSSNLDYNVWPRAAAVAERLWSDITINGSATASVYIRLDNQRWRMQQKMVNVQPVWPVYCTYNPEKCMQQLRS